MNLHEFQAKRLFADYGIPVPLGHIVSSVAEAREVARLPASEGGWVVKAQIHSGGRGKGGGVKMVQEPSELEDVARGLLGMNLVTPQTGPAGSRG